MLQNLSRTIHSIRREGLRVALTKAAYYTMRPLTNLWHRDFFWQGRIVEILGNRASIYGLKIDLNNPYMLTYNKAEFLKGHYEQAEEKLIQRYLPSDSPVIELGASIGVISCLVNKRLRDPMQHVVVEANSHLIETLKLNRQLNDCKFTIVNAAIAYDASTVAFPVNSSSMASSVFRHSEEIIEVSSITIEQIANQYNFSRFNLICDIEGSEVTLIRNELNYLTKHVKWLIIEIHPRLATPEDIDVIMQLLREAGFSIKDSSNNTFCYLNKNI